MPASTQPTRWRRARLATSLLLVGIVSGLLVAFRWGVGAWPGDVPASPSPLDVGAPFAQAIEAFRELLRADVNADRIGGITAAVVVDDRMIWAEGFGWADRSRRIPAGAETIYRLGSISKSIAAVELAHLVDAGVVHLDDPVERHMPDVRRFRNSRPGARPITLRQLASHTAGLEREPRLTASVGAIDTWEAKVLGAIATAGFVAAPGDTFVYSNIGYAALGLALSRAAGAPFMELVARDVFIPLGMTHSAYRIDDGQRSALATGYFNATQFLVNASWPAHEHLGRGYRVPNGGIYSTVGDLARFVAALTGSATSVLSDSMRRTMETIQTPAGTVSGYGLGLWISHPSDSARTLMGHGGLLPGYTADIEFNPHTRIGVILLRNYQYGRTNLAQRAGDLVLRLSAEQRRQ